MTENPYQTPQQHSNEPISGLLGYGPVRNLSNLAKFSKVMLILNIIITVIASGLTMSSAYKEALASAINGIDNGSGIFQQIMIAGVIAVIIFIITVVVFCMWTHGAMKNTWAIRKINPTITPGWAVGWYFIPFANLWKPYTAMSEIWSGVYGHSKSRVTILVWWFTWIFSGIITQISTKLPITTDTTVLDLLSSILSIIAAVFLIKIINNITEYQNSKVSESF